MADCNISDNMLDEAIISGGCEISSVIDQVIEQVERQKLDVPSSSNPFAMIENTKNLSFSSLNTSKSVDSPTERSKRHRSGGKKIRVRHKKRKWKPYCKLNWEERKRLEERDSRRAYRSREKMSASGLTLAPYNTTQFLMEDHNLEEPDYLSIHHNKEDCHSYDSEEDFYSSPDDEEEFLHQQFSETYDSFHDAYINNMSKFELVRELMRLEDEIEVVEKTLRECREQRKMLAEYPCLDVDAEMEKIQVFQDEIVKLTQENSVLEKNNELLQNRVSTSKSE